MSVCKKISNIIIIIAFFIIITVPQILFAFLKDEIPVDTSENRKLAEKPEFKIEEIDKYGTNYESYYNDNLPFRSLIRNTWTNFNFYVLNESTTTQVLIGKNDGDISSTWLFFQDENESNAVKETQGIYKFSNEKEKSIINAIKENTEKLKEKEVELFYTIIPNKENLYKEKLPDNITIYDEKTRVDKLVDYINDETDIANVLYLKDSLNEAKKEEQVYYRQDTHWNEYGAFLGFKEIVNKIAPTYNDFYCEIEFSEEQIIEKDLSKMSGIKDILKDRVPKVEFLPEVEYASTVFETENRIEITECENAPIDKTLMVVGDSFRVAMIPYFSKIYTKVIFLHRCDYGSYMLEAYQPDIIVCQFLERYVDTLDEFKLY